MAPEEKGMAWRHAKTLLVFPPAVEKDMGKHLEKEHFHLHFTAGGTLVTERFSTRTY